VNVNIFNPEHADILAKLKSLPTSCVESARHLESEAEFYTREGVFPAGTIESFVKRLKDYKDKDLSERLYQKTEQTKKLVQQYLHCM
jgi:glutamine synthetase